MPPRLPADHPIEGPGVQPRPEERLPSADRPVEPAVQDATILQDLTAAASPLVPEAGTAEGPSGADRRNRVILPLCVGLVLAALLVLLWLA